MPNAVTKGRKSRAPTTYSSGPCRISCSSGVVCGWGPSPSPSQEDCRWARGARGLWVGSRTAAVSPPLPAAQFVWQSVTDTDEHTHHAYKTSPWSVYGAKHLPRNGLCALTSWPVFVGCVICCTTTRQGYSLVPVSGGGGRQLKPCWFSTNYLRDYDVTQNQFADSAEMSRAGERGLDLCQTRNSRERELSDQWERRHREEVSDSVAVLITRKQLNFYWVSCVWLCNRQSPCGGCRPRVALDVVLFRVLLCCTGVHCSPASLSSWAVCWELVLWLTHFWWAFVPFCCRLSQYTAFLSYSEGLTFLRQYRCG